MPLLNIDIDIRETVEEFQLDTAQVESMVSSVKKALILEIYRNWVAQAQSELNSTRQSYIRGLQVFDESSSSGGVKLIGKLNNMVENGCNPFDMKAKMLQSSKAKLSKDKKLYMNVPFRFAVPDSIGDSELFSSVMPQEIYSLVKDRTEKQPLKQADIPEQFAAVKTRQAVIDQTVGKLYDKYIHKTSLFEGMVKSKGSSGHTGYSTFRTISEKSDPASWIHSGIKQYNLAKQAIQSTDVDTITNNTVDKFLSEIL